ncbi:MAG: gluconate 2-dehydrogenase subunit 3 family protein [Acidobacteria bacterium]|nr:gluconate 2-dehydrogenase subunit 3 family protein [Acidobacteriota bacterium]
MTLISRRDLLKRAGLAAVVPVARPFQGRDNRGAVPVARPVQGRDDRGAESPALQGRREPLEHLTAAESDLLEAIVARLIPSDALGPGAAEARAAHYIDRALGGALASSRSAYAAGLAALDRYSRSSRGAPFSQLSPTDQDSLLIDVETSAATGFTGGSAAFFNMVRTHTWQGTFGDPYYGGNANFVGWDLIGYPGIRTMVSAEDQRRLEHNELKPNHKSAYDTDMFNKAMAERLSHPGSQMTGAQRRGRASARAGRPRRDWPRGRNVADQTRFRARRDPEQRAQLADGRAESQRRSPDVQGDAVGADEPRRQPSDDECGRRHRAPLLGAELAPEPVGLQGGERDEAALWRLADPERVNGGGLAVRVRRTRAVLRQDRIRDGRVGTSRQRQRQDRSARQSVRGAAQAPLSDAAAARNGLPREDGGVGAVARVARVSRSRVDQFTVVPEPIGLHVSRVLQ